MSKNNVLQFSSSNTRSSRKKRNNWNYFKTLFFVSLIVNVLLLSLYLVK